MSELLEMINDQLTEIGREINGSKLSKTVTDYIYLTEDIWEFAQKVTNHQRHLALVPMVNELHRVSAGHDPRVWWMIYRDLAIKTGYPIEVFQALNLSLAKTDGYIIRCEGPVTNESHNPTSDEDVLEQLYGVAMVGIEEDWWDIDDLSTLPPRQESVLKALQANNAMGDMEQFMNEMFDSSDDGESEGGFAGEWTA